MLSSNTKYTYKQNISPYKHNDIPIYKSRNNKYTYKLIIEHFSDEEIAYVKNILEKRGNWEEAANNSLNVTFMYIYHVYTNLPKHIWNIKTNIVSDMQFNKPRISDKDVFYNIFKKTFPQQHTLYMPPQYNININNYKISDPKSGLGKLFDGESLWLAKSTRGYGGKGIQMLTNRDEYESFFKEYYQNSENSHNKWVLSRYIKNPLLINGYKFHLRVPLVYFLKKNNKGIGFVANKSMIWTASKPYVQNDWLNREIHDTRLRTSYSKTLEYPKDLKFSSENIRNHIDEQIHDIAVCVIEIINKIRGLTCWPGTINCFYILGMDIMINAEYGAKILEINENAVIFNENSEYKKNLIDGLIYHIIDPLFPPIYKFADNGFFKKVDFSKIKGGFLINDYYYHHKYLKYKKKYLELRSGK